MRKRRACQIATDDVLKNLQKSQKERKIYKILESLKETLYHKAEIISEKRKMNLGKKPQPGVQ